ncbi:hypothetical protein [Serratia fonticola]|uniref:hypothetical protein n=1 Tax=Serratia fonticola TaxID=47917 RepID=UPI003AB0F592
MTVCQKEHRYDPYFSRLPEDQGDFERHKCAGCAYELGYEAGLRKDTQLNIEAAVNSIVKSQAGEVRHKSPAVAFAQGYTDGLFEYYRQS